MLVTSVDPLVAFIADEAMVRFCTEDYQKPSKDNMHKVLGHLTNFSLNKLSEKFVNTKDIEDQEDASKRTLSSLMKTLQEAGVDTQHVF